MNETDPAQIMALAHRMQKGRLEVRNTSRCREKVEGWLGRRRTYRCRWCGRKFTVDTLAPLPEDRRVCGACLTNDYAEPEALLPIHQKQMDFILGKLTL